MVRITLCCSVSLNAYVGFVITSAAHVLVVSMWLVAVKSTVTHSDDHSCVGYEGREGLLEGIRV